MNRLVHRALVLLAGGVLAPMALADLPAHPSDIEFPPLEFKPPVATEFRSELARGVPVYLAASHEFPLVNVTLTFRGGTYLERDGETGLASALGQMMRRGGTTSVSAEELDERLDFLAARVSVGVASETASALLDCLKSNFDDAFGLFMDMVRNPGFDEGRLRVHQDEVLERLKQRNDSPMSVMQLNMGELMFGADHYLGRQPTQATIDAITPAGLRGLHGRIFHPGNVVIAVTGDFEPSEMLSVLERALDGWAIGEKAGTPAAPTKVYSPGLYHADTAQDDLPQGTTVLIQRSVARDDPDTIPLEVMNHILGGGGFTSRIMSRVRSDEGLAYGASSFLQTPVYFPGFFGAFFQSKNSTVALATKIIVEEIDRIRTEPVGDDELTLAKNAFIERFPQQFASKPTMLRVFVDDELTDRDPEFWATYRDRVADVTAGEVLRVAGQHLNPAEMAILVIGNWDEIYTGDLEGRASMNDFFGGNVDHLPMRDPLTLQPK